MSDLSPNLKLPLIAPFQAMKHITHNKGLARLDALTQLSVAPQPGWRVWDMQNAALRNDRAIDIRREGMPL